MPNEIKQLRYGSIAAPIAAVAGSFTLTFDSQTTDAIAWDAIAADIEAALEEPGSIGSGNVEVTDDGGGGFYIEFVGALANTDVGALTADSSLKQAAATVAVTEVQAGRAFASSSIDDDFTDGDESNPATMAFTFDPLPTSGSWSVDGNTYNWNETPTPTGWTFDGPASSNPTATADSNGSTSPLSYSDINLGVPGQVQIDTVELTDAPTEGQFFLNEEIAGELGPFGFGETASHIEAIFDSYLAPYSVTGFNGGPWTLTSVAELPYDFVGYENGSSPLRKALGMEIETDREGGSIEGAGDVAFDVSALDSAGAIDSTGTGSIVFAVSALGGAGCQPNAGPGAVSFAVSALASVGSVPLAGPGSVTFAAALAGSGSIPNLGSGGVSFDSALASGGIWGLLASGGVAVTVSELLARCELADTSLSYKHNEQFSNIQIIGFG